MPAPIWTVGPSRPSASPAKLIIIHTLRDNAGDHIDHKPRTAQLIGEDAVGSAILDHVVRHVTPAGVDETAHHRPAAIEFGNRPVSILIQEPLHQGASDLHANATGLAVDD